MPEHRIDAPPEPPDELRRRSSLVMQTLPILLIPFGVVLLTIGLIQLFVAIPENVPAPPPPALPVLVTVVFFSALILLVRLRRPTVSALLLIGAWTLITVGAAARGGVTSNLIALLIVPICVAGLLIDGVASVTLAALGTVLVLSLAWMEWRGLPVGWPTAALPPEVSLTLNTVFWVVLFWVVAALTSLLSRGLQQALRESRRRAAELRALSDELESRVATQTAQLLDQAQAQAVLEERTRLAREIHDTLAQGLAGVAVQLGAIRQGLGLLGEGAPPRLLDDLGENLSLAERTTRATLAEARRSVWNLRQPLLERAGLVEALEQVAAQATVRTTASTTGEAWPLPPVAEGALLRVAQEALANSQRHGAARSATLTLSYAPQGVELLVTDDGRGFPPEILERRPAPSLHGGFGILGMQERLAALGGTLELSNAGGACVRAWVPRHTP
jgi:signal transduction histidine kinase